MNNGVIFGGLVATALLALYVLSIVTAVGLSLQPHPAPGDTAAIEAARIAADAFDGGGYSYILNTIGALISASVISTLAVTDPQAQDLPGARALRLNDWKAYIPSLYIIAWMLCGLAAVYFGMLHHETEVSALTAQGKAWLGTAVASVYAYFGVSAPSGGTTGGGQPKTDNPAPAATGKTGS